MPDTARLSPLTVNLILAGLALASAAAFMTVGAKGRWDFVLAFRGTRLAGMVLVAYAVAVSTVLFQTVTQNRILTPSIMGFDALYVLIQTVLVFFLGAAGLGRLDPRLLFAVETAVMAGFSLLLFRWLFSGAVRSLHLLVLTGLVFGILFRSLSSFLQRIMDPNAFVVLQDRMFASFNVVDRQLLLFAAMIVAGISIAGWRLMNRLDVVALGRDTAIGLGVDYRRTVTLILAAIALLVSVSTALVGPVTFFGLLVANIAYQLVPSYKHADVLPAAIFLAVITLAGGQLLLEQLFSFDTALAIVIEFLGGIVFIALLLRGAAR